MPLSHSPSSRTGAFLFRLRGAAGKGEESGDRSVLLTGTISAGFGLDGAIVEGGSEGGNCELRSRVRSEVATGTDSFPEAEPSVNVCAVFAHFLDCGGLGGIRMVNLTGGSKASSSSPEEMSITSSFPARNCCFSFDLADKVRARSLARSAMSWEYDSNASPSTADLVFPFEPLDTDDTVIPRSSGAEYVDVWPSVIGSPLDAERSGGPGFDDPVVRMLESDTTSALIVDTSIEDGALFEEESFGAPFLAAAPLYAGRGRGRGLHAGFEDELAPAMIEGMVLAIFVNDDISLVSPLTCD